MEGRCDKWEARGKCDTIVWQKNEKKRKKENQIHHGLKRPQTNQFQSINQPKIDVRNRGEYGGEVQQVGGALGKHDTIVWAEI